MKSSIFNIILFFCLSISAIKAQNVTYEFANAQITNAGPNSSYEVDIMISSSSGFKLGSGQLYFDYNTAAFGNSITSSGGMSFTTSGYILGQSSGPFGIYSNFIANDNTSSRLSFSWQQALSSACITSDNVTNVTTALFHLRMDYIAGGAGQNPELCFTTVVPFDDQTFTACGPGASCTFPDCISSSGTQITNDAFDCSASAPLPVELIAFKATAEDGRVQLEWETASEQNNDYFFIEKSKDAQTFKAINKVDGTGTTNEVQYYQSWDNAPYIGINYYRLKQVDQDGSFVYSEIRAVEFKGIQAVVNIYPNPTSDFLTIQISEDDPPRHLRLFNELGQVVLEDELKAGEYSQTFSIEHLPKGIYILRIGVQEPVFTKKIILQ